MTKKFAKIAAVSISVLLIVLSACSKETPAEKIENLISSGEYSKAVNYYLKNTSKISESDAGKLFKDGLNTVLASYMDEETDKDNITKFVVALEAVGSNDLSSYGKMIYKAVDNVDSAKTKFEEAEKEFKDENYPPAIPLYSEVIELYEDIPVTYGVNVHGDGHTVYDASARRITEIEDAILSLDVIVKTDYINALNAIGIKEEDIYTIEDTGFIFHGSTIFFDVVYFADCRTAFNNLYVYSHCDNVSTAKELFDYYYNENYAAIFNNENIFSGYKVSEIQKNKAFVFVEGSCITQNGNVEKHDALYLFGDTVVYVSLGSNDSTAKEEIDTFMDSLGYYHP